MVCNVYTFLVGIDNYPNPIPPLQGCVNDINAFEEYLQGWIQGNSDYVLKQPYRLINEQATRQALIEGFRTYLCQAQASDVALFYYSGHGSQALSPQQFWTIEPDRLNETLVCWDSRFNGHWDLADKELAVLITEVAQRNPHIIVILDCCHSGAGTRSTGQFLATRQIPTDLRQRPIDTFLRSPESLGNATISRSPFLSGSNSVNSEVGNPDRLHRWTLPQGRHILLAACRDREEAHEFFGNGVYCGAFSYFLLETLKQSGGLLTYHDLFRRTNARLRSQISAQSPQLEATDSADLDQLFLGGALTHSCPYYTVSYHRSNGWTIDGGAVHGIPAPIGDDRPKLAVFPFNATPNILQDATQAIARVEVSKVLPQLSQLDISSNTSPFTDVRAVYKAILISIPLPLITVSLTGDRIGIQQIRTALKTASPNGQASLYLKEIVEPDPAQIALRARDGSYQILRATDGTHLASPVLGYTLDRAMEVVRQLEHIARWMTVADLSRPATSQIPGNALQIHIYQGTESEPLSQPEICLAYTWDAEQQKWQQPTFRVKLSNQSNLTLFCALYDLSETFKIQSVLESGTVCLEPKQEIWLAQGQPLYGTVPKALWQEGVTEFHDILKVIACTTDFNATLLEQDELGYPLKRSRETYLASSGTLNRLMQRAITRDFRTTPETEETIYDDWITSQVTFTISRPQPAIAIDKVEQIDLGQGISLSAHPTLQATARLTTLARTSRDLKHPLLPPLLTANPQVTQPLQFTANRSLESGLNVLELDNVNNPGVVTSAQPLTLTVPIVLQPHEYVLPIAFDGTFFVPLGKARSKGQDTEIRLERLPSLTKNSTRSLNSSIQILFQKIVAHKLGLECSYPILAALDWSESEMPRYVTDRVTVTQKVAKSQKILLYIHGIIGDTQSMVSSARQSQVTVDGQQKSLVDLYDLVLAFDYESLNTPIPDLAKQLRDCLTAVGLGPDRGKQLHIVAHSIGGLIARCLIEQQSGNQIVQHLILLGTPNAGSPWATVEDWAIAILTIGLNSLSSVALPVKALGSLMAAIEWVDVSLDQIRPGSDFLRFLADSPDPGIPYTVLAGNVSLVTLPEESTRNRLIQLLEQVSRTAIEFPFLGQPNDLAATVYSVHALPQSRSPQPQLLEVACHHLNYLTDPVGLQALSQAILETRILETDSKAPHAPTAEVALPLPNPQIRFTSDSNKLWFWGLLLLFTISIVGGVLAGLVLQRDSSGDNQIPEQPAKNDRSSTVW